MRGLELSVVRFACPTALLWAELTDNYKFIIML